MPSHAVEITQLTMRYAGRSVVDGLSLSAPTGALTIVLGPNGAGKTTTIETAEGFRVAQSGQVRVLGRDPQQHGAELAARVGVMLQSGGVWPSLRPDDMLAHVARLYAHPLPIDPLMERLGLTGVARTAYRRLSGGEQQKLGLACALIGRPELVFLDEPTTGLDPASRLTVWDELRRINGLGTTVFLTTQYLEEADQLCDRLAIIDGGKIVREGTPASLKADLKAKLKLETDPTLDDVFLDVTGRSRERAAGEVREVQS